MPQFVLVAIFKAIVTLVISYALNRVVQALAGKPQVIPTNHIPPSRAVTVRGTVEYRQMIYGQIVTGGFMGFFGTSGTNNKYLWFVIVYAGHECTAIDDLYLDARLIEDSDIDGSTHEVTTSTFAGSSDTGGGSKLSIWKHLGTSTQAVDAQLAAAFPEWDANHVGYGLPYVVYRLERDDTAWPNGEPTNFRALVKGRKLYDPRKDSTSGGSGSHRFTDASTWEWSQNWALAVRDYISGGAVVYVSGTPDKRLGVAELDSRIDDAYIIAAANSSDEAVTVPLPMLPGTIDFTNGIEGLTGYGTQFTRIGLPLWLLAPNGSMVQVGFIGGDTDALLSANYAGPTADGVRVHYATSNISSTTESRFTCDGQLSCGNVHGENLATLLSAGNGHLSYVSGKYRLFAGVYTTPTVTLDDDDFLDSVELSTHPTADQMWNFVTGTFFDEDNDWSQSSFPPQRNTTYETDDGRQYPRAIDLQMTRGNYRAQRLAQVVLNQSRNFFSLNAKGCSQKAADASVWDTINVNIAEYAWVNQILRVNEWRFLSSGMIGMVCRGEGSSAYADPALGVYVDPSTNNPPSFTLSPPDPPTALVALSFPGLIDLFSTLPAYFKSGSVVEFWEYTSNSPFSSAIKIGSSRASAFQVYKADTVTRYYWATVLDPTGGRSSSYPSGAGVAGAALLTTSYTLIARGTCVVNGTQVSKPTGSGAWDSDAYSPQGFLNGCFVSARVAQTTTFQMVGLSTNPTSTVSYTKLNFGLYQASGTLHAYELGTDQGPFGSYAVGDSLEIRYDGVTARYFHNGALIRAVRAPGLTLYPAVCQDSVGSVVSGIEFGPASAVNQPTGSWLNTYPWVVGSSGSQGNYADEGLASGGVAGQIVLQVGPYGTTEPLWRCAGPVTASVVDGGWNNNGDLFGIDSSKTYRSVAWALWNGASATTSIYFGCSSLSGTPDYTCTVGTQTPVANPYFVPGINAAGNLSPNKWYLLVGILHGSSYTGSDTGAAGVYDPATGQRIYAGTEFNILAGASYQMQRAYQYDSRNTSDVVFFGKPRWDEVNGNEPSLQALMQPASAYQGWVETGNTVQSGQAFSKQGGTAAWDSTAYTVNAYTTCHISGKPISAAGSLNMSIMGLAESPAAANLGGGTAYSTPNHYFEILNSNGAWAWEETGGTSGGFSLSVSTTDLAEITYDGSTITYLINKVSVRTVSVAGLLLHGFIVPHDSGAGFNAVSFGPTTNLAVEDTAQLGQNAAGTIASAYSATFFSLTCHGGSTADDDLITINVATLGLPIAIDITGQVYGSMPGGAGNQATCTSCVISAYRDGTQVASSTYDASTLVNSAPAGSNSALALAVTLSITDSPASGNHTYTLHIHMAASGTSGQTCAINFDEGFMKVREIRR